MLAGLIHPSNGIYLVGMVGLYWLFQYAARVPRDWRALGVRVLLLGIAAAYGFALSFNKLKAVDARSLTACIERTTNLFTSTRPTATNLFWAVNEC